MISDISLINLAKTTPYSLEDIRKIAAQVESIEDLLDILSHAKATNSNPFDVLREFEKHGGNPFEVLREFEKHGCIFYDRKNYHDEGDMIEEYQELNPDFVKISEHIREAVTEAGLAFAESLKPLIQAINNLPNDPKMKAMLAALPEPEPEEKENNDKTKTFVCMDYDPAYCGHRCEITTILNYDQVLIHCPVGSFAGTVTWQDINEDPEKEEPEK